MKKFKRSIALSLIMTLVLTLLPINGVMGEVAEEDNEIHIESTYPLNNQENVEVNPLIQFKFNEEVELVEKYVEKEKIKISSDGEEFAVNLSKDAFVSFEGKTLKIDINSIGRKGKFNLRENTVYKITLEEGALKLKNNLGEDVFNKEEDLYFITGRDNISSNKGLFVEKYSSDIKGTDSIDSMYSTQLDSDGNIYLHFNKKIQWNKYDVDAGVKTDKQALKHFELYKRPKEHRGHGNNKLHIYDIDKKTVPKTGEKVEIESLEIIKDDNNKNTNILKIKPKNKFVDLNEYILKINKKGILISFEDDVLHEDDVLRSRIGQSIWTKSSNDKDIPKWDRDSSPEDIIEEENAPNKENENGYYKGYAINGAPKYDDETPIVIHVDKEVILKPHYYGFRSPLSDVEFYENYTGSEKSENLKDIKKYEIEYYMQDGIKKTKLLLYPKDQLEAGKEYKLDIKEGTFVTRGNMPLEGINLRFAVEGDSSVNKGINSVRITVNGETRTNEIFDDYLYFKDDSDTERMHDVGFEIEGYNFTEDIEKIELKKIGEYKIDEEDEGQRKFYREKLKKENEDEDKDKDESESNDDFPENPESPYPDKPRPEKPEQDNIQISTENVKFGSVNKITGKFDEEALKELSKAENLGDYDVIVTFKESNSKVRRRSNKAKSNGNKNSQFLNKLRSCMEGPELLPHSPRENAVIDHENLEKITVRFKDIYRDVKNRLRDGNETTKKVDEFKVTELGKNENLIKRKANGKKDITAIQRGGSGEIKFDILLDTSKLEEGKTYEVTIPEDSVRCKFNFAPHHNKQKIWTFTTTDESKADKIYQGSVPENYDASYPLMIEGKNLTYGLRVRFKNVATGNIYSTDKRSEYIKADPDKKGQKDRLMVYLPKKNKLPVGLYNILIYSGEGLEDEYEDGVFSVVENGKYVPNEEYRDKDTVIDDTTVEGNLKEIIKTSKNELELLSKYTGKTLDIDSIMGEEVLTRDIKYNGSFVSALDTKSKWSNVKLTGLKRKSSKKPMTIRLGRAEPKIRDNIKKKLRGENIKSEFIIVGGENYSAEKLNLTIPYKQSNGKNLKVLKYNEETRRINKINIYDRNINKKDKCVEIDLVNALPSDNATKGIFVVVE